jgi:hypothetical protein
MLCPRAVRSSMRQFKNQPSNLDRPMCPVCVVPMWLVQIEVETATPDSEIRTFECKACGLTVVEMARS